MSSMCAREYVRATVCVVHKKEIIVLFKFSFFFRFTFFLFFLFCCYCCRLFFINRLIFFCVGGKLKKKWSIVDILPLHSAMICFFAQRFFNYKQISSFANLNLRRNERWTMKTLTPRGSTCSNFQQKLRAIYFWDEKHLRFHWIQWGKGKMKFSSVTF